MHFCLFACFCFLPSFFACWIVGLLVCLLFLKMISLTHAIRFGFSLNNLESVVSTDWWLGLCGPLRNAAGKWKCLLLLLDKYNIPGVNWRCLIFSSPEHKMLMVSYCDRPLSVVRRRAACDVRHASTLILKHLLLWNRSFDFDQTSQEWFLCVPLPKLLKPFQLAA